MKLYQNYRYLVLISVLMAFVWGCSPKTLSVFFDGVPDPADTVPVFASDQSQKPGVSNSSGLAAREPAVKYYFHSPYQQKECASCHDPAVMGKLLDAIPGLCYSCHDDFVANYKVLHAPVEGGECLICHKPHMSDTRHLLQKPGQQLCFDCHDNESIIQAEYHADIGKDDCTDCHNPHGGNEKFMLN
jgi:predicted CXXCH cytochrome family protein